DYYCLIWHNNVWLF
nr:immunoglobulin light chain junction region [Macaca mulatta]